MAKSLVIPPDEFPVIEVTSSEMIFPKTLGTVNVKKYPELVVLARNMQLPYVFVIIKLKKDVKIADKIDLAGVVATVKGADSENPEILIGGEYVARIKDVKKVGRDIKYQNVVVERLAEDEFEGVFVEKGGQILMAPKHRNKFKGIFYDMKLDIARIMNEGVNFIDSHLQLLEEIYDVFDNHDLEQRDSIDCLVWRVVQAMPHRDPSGLQHLVGESSLMRRIGVCSMMLKDNIDIVSFASDYELSSRRKTKGGADNKSLPENEDKIMEKSMDNADPEIVRRWKKYKEIEEFIREDAKEVIFEDLKRLISYGSPQGNSYEWPKFIRRLDFILGLPWKEESPAEDDILKVGSVLDEDHYGLNYIKDQICDSIAPKILNPEGKGHIICFVGPPGVGKTSLAKSIARALKRKYVRMSVGGIKDEAQIRGHSITYMGSEPGEILKLVKSSGVRNTVFVVDEIDKLGRMSTSGDPSSAMLEVFDSEQNNSFKDHYASCGFDLSRVMFIATANVEEDIIGPLRDRMDIIRLPGYLEVEKVEIAKRYLLPRRMREVGLSQHNVHVEWGDDVMSWVIRGYTSEAGVRNLERIIATVLRKIAREYLESSKKETTQNIYVVDKESIYKYLGPMKVFKDRARVTLVGEAIGLAWTPVGGDILYIQAKTYARSQDKKVFARTGMQGEVMKESDEVALTILRNDAVSDPEIVRILSESGMHLHIPEGAVPKDGPSAGITIEVAMYSATRKKLVRPFVAMTGEIDLMKRVLPVGGIREKIVAAERAGIKEVIMPKDNERNLHDVPKEIKDKLKFHFVESVDEAIKIAFENE